MMNENYEKQAKQLNTGEGSATMELLEGDYYEILGLDRKVTAEEILSAYRTLVKQYHPDRNPGNAVAEENMKRINVAYEVLSDENLRHQYDTMGAVDGFRLVCR